MKCRDVQDLAQGGDLLATMLQEDESSSKWLRSGRSKVRSHLLYRKWMSITREKKRKGEDTERDNPFFFQILCSRVLTWVLVYRSVCVEVR